MIRVMLWEPGQLTPTTPIIQQTSDVSPAMALTIGNLAIGLQADDMFGANAVETIYLGRLNGFEEFDDVIAIVDEDSVAKDLPVNEHATVMARFLGAHPRDIPHEGLHGKVVFANREPNTGRLTNVHPTVVALGLAGADRERFREGMDLPDSITIPPGVIVDTPQLFQTNLRARQAGCDLLLPGWTSVMLAGEGIYHTITNQCRRIQHTASGVAYLRCHVLLAVWVEQQKKPVAFSTWLDVPLMTYITLPVPARWDPTHPDFQGGNTYQDHVTVADLMRGDG